MILACQFLSTRWEADSRASVGACARKSPRQKPNVGDIEGESSVNSIPRAANEVRFAIRIGGTEA